MKYYWMAVTSDKYELPICVEDTCSELAIKIGKSLDAIKCSTNQGLSGKKTGIKYVKVERIV